MIQATNSAERFADRLHRLMHSIFGGPYSPLAQRLVPFLHSRREFAITKETIGTSHSYQEATGTATVPAGEHITLYFWLGCVYRFWDGEMIGIDTCVDSGLGSRYKWDMEKYEPKQEDPSKSAKCWRCKAPLPSFSCGVCGDCVDKLCAIMKEYDDKERDGE